MNCRAPVEESGGKLFKGVWTCATCHGYAERAYQRLQKELKYLLTVSGEAIRIALIEGRMHPPTEPAQEVSKADLLRTIMQVADHREKCAAEDTAVGTRGVELQHPGLPAKA